MRSAPPAWLVRDLQSTANSLEPVSKIGIEGAVSPTRAPREEHGDGDAVERLEDLDIYGDGQTLPVSGMIDRLCEDLGLDPDWDRMAEEGWARAEIRSGKAGSPPTDTKPRKLVVQWLPSEGTEATRRPVPRLPEARPRPPRYRRRRH